jgi:hypothetical protein
LRRRRKVQFFKAQTGRRCFLRARDVMDFSFPDDDDDDENNDDDKDDNDERR